MWKERPTLRPEERSGLPLIPEMKVRTKKRKRPTLKVK